MDSADGRAKVTSEQVVESLKRAGSAGVHIGHLGLLAMGLTDEEIAAGPKALSAARQKELGITVR